MHDKRVIVIYLFIIKYFTYIYLTKVSHPNKQKNNSLSNFLCKLVIAKQLILKTRQHNYYGNKNKEKKRVIQTFEC